MKSHTEKLLRKCIKEGKSTDPVQRLVKKWDGAVRPSVEGQENYLHDLFVRMQDERDFFDNHGPLTVGSDLAKWRIVSNVKAKETYPRVKCGCWWW